MRTEWKTINSSRSIGRKQRHKHKIRCGWNKAVSAGGKGKRDSGRTVAGSNRIPADPVSALCFAELLPTLHQAHLPNLHAANSHHHRHRHQPRRSQPNCRFRASAATREKRRTGRTEQRVLCIVVPNALVAGAASRFPPMAVWAPEALPTKVAELAAARTGHVVATTGLLNGAEAAWAGLGVYWA